jgi:hypothetical protein
LSKGMLKSTLSRTVLFSTLKSSNVLYSFI